LPITDQPAPQTHILSRAGTAVHIIKGPSLTLPLQAHNGNVMLGIASVWKD